MATQLPDFVIMWNDSLTTNKHPSTTLNPDYTMSSNTTVAPTEPPNTLHLEYIGYVFVPLFLVCFSYFHIIHCKPNHCKTRWYPWGYSDYSQHTNSNIRGGYSGVRTNSNPKSFNLVKFLFKEGSLDSGPTQNPKSQVLPKFSIKGGGVGGSLNTTFFKYLSWALKAFCTKNSGSLACSCIANSPSQDVCGD